MTNFGHSRWSYEHGSLSRYKPKATSVVQRDLIQMARPSAEGPEKKEKQREEEERDLGELTDFDKFRMSCLRIARYHEDRERFFAGVHRISMFVVVGSGTASFASFKEFWPYFALIITLAGLLDLVFGISDKARLHGFIRRQMYDLLAQSETDKRSIEDLKEQLIRISAEEPPYMRAVNELAYNSVMITWGRDQRHLVQTRWYHRLFRNVISFASTRFRTYDEVYTEQHSRMHSTDQKAHV